MQTTTRISRPCSRHARIPGDCPVCLYPLQGRNKMKRPCKHMLRSQCYFDGVFGGKDSSFDLDACEQCRHGVLSYTPRLGTGPLSFTTSTKHPSNLWHQRQSARATSLEGEPLAKDLASAASVPKGPVRVPTSEWRTPRGQGGRRRSMRRRLIRRMVVSLMPNEATCGGSGSQFQQALRTLCAHMPARCYVAAHQACSPKHQAYFGDNQTIYLWS